MKVIFLDVDGVLNSHESRVAGNGPHFYQPHFDQLVRIVKETGCKIVVSSAWRRSTIAATLSCQPGFGAEARKMAGAEDIWSSFIGVTGEDRKARRGVEILTWVAEHCIGFDGTQLIKEYAVLDDEEVGSGLHPSKLFRTDFETGLTPEIADAVIAHLNGGASRG